MKEPVRIDTAGRALPFSFGMAALARFCEAEGLALADLGQLGEGMTPLRALNLVWHGLRDGHRRDNKDFTLSLEDVGDLIDDDPTLLQRCMDAMADYMPKAEAGNGKAAR